MLLSDLLGTEVALPAGAGAIEVVGLSADSRTVLPGTVFFAFAGSKADGSRFVDDAVTKGAVAVVASPGAAARFDVPVVLVDEPRRALALAAARFAGTQPATVVAVTGTNGKTSVAEFARQIFAACGHRAASLGTIGIVKPDGALYGSLTTPDPVSLHTTLKGFAGEGITHLAMEASSHGLDQHRLDGVRLVAGAFTNLGRDHLDYHPTIEAYLDAKLRLFSDLLQPGQGAVINLDGPRSEDALAAAKTRGLAIHSVGTRGETLRLATLLPEGFAQRLSVIHAGKRHDLRLPLVGAYQASNALVAAGLAIAAGEAPEAALAALEGLKGVKGRLEIVGEARGRLGIVDYAHKPEALEAALDACRPFARGKLICVFGCGGDRDRGKRAIMGRIAVSKADVTIVTDDNPRSEEPAAIRSEILAGAKGAREIGDRRAAIEAAVELMEKGDVVIVAGKGHETGQIVGNTVLPFSDHDVLKAALDQA